MEACSTCGSHQWFMERAWSISEQHEIYRVICKKDGQQFGWARTEDEAIAFWNKGATARTQAQA